MRKLNQSGAKDNSSDYCPEETKHFLAQSLENCRPVSNDLNWRGRKRLEYYLGKNDLLGSLLAIDGNSKPTKRAMCILVLKTAAQCICSGYDEEVIRAVTYSYLALRPGGLV